VVGEALGADVDVEAAEEGVDAVVGEAAVAEDADLVVEHGTGKAGWAIGSGEGFEICMGSGGKVRQRFSHRGHLRGSNASLVRGFREERAERASGA
jgi:hypothetical protein